MKTLPDTYYLNHFEEFLAFVEGPCAHLLAEPEQAFINDFHALDNAAKCLLVRIYNRKADWVARDTLQYREIEDIPSQLQTLCRQRWLEDFTVEDLPDWLLALNKQQLQRLYAAASCADTAIQQPAKSANKAHWQQTLIQLAKCNPVRVLEWAEANFIKQGRSSVLSYLLFLYFGRVQARLNQLSVRDLGIMRTRRLQHETQARFASRAEAYNAEHEQRLSIQIHNQVGLNKAGRTVKWIFNPEQTYVVVDVETTGMNTAGHKITEIGMVKVVNGQVVATWHSLINPQRPIPWQITQLTGISNSMVADAPVFNDVVGDIAEFLHGTVFVAHNVSFDYGFFQREFEQCGRYLKLPKLCTVKLARQHFPGLASYSLGKLCADLNINLVQHHRALDDARAAADVLIRVQRHSSTQS